MIAGVLLALLLAGPVPASARDGCIVFDDFAGSAAGAFPNGWKVREESGRAVYTVRAEGDRRYLHAAARNLGVQAALERGWDLTAYPVLHWKWRSRQFPLGADEQAGRNDSAVGVYAVFPYRALVVRTVKALKYIWSEKVPKGTMLEASHGLTKMLVLESGAPPDRDRWVEERVNVAADYARPSTTRRRPSHSASPSSPTRTTPRATPRATTRTSRPAGTSPVRGRSGARTTRASQLRPVSPRRRRDELSATRLARPAPSPSPCSPQRTGAVRAAGELRPLTVAARGRAARSADLGLRDRRGRAPPSGSAREFR